MVLVFYPPPPSSSSSHLLIDSNPKADLENGEHLAQNTDRSGRCHYLTVGFVLVGVLTFLFGINMVLVGPCALQNVGFFNSEACEKVDVASGTQSGISDRGFIEWIGKLQTAVSRPHRRLDALENLENL